MGAALSTDGPVGRPDFISFFRRLHTPCAENHLDADSIGSVRHDVARLPDSAVSLLRIFVYWPFHTLATLCAF